MLFVAIPLVERLGRRTLLLWFAPICIFSLLIIGGVLRAEGPAVGPVLVTFAYGEPLPVPPCLFESANNA